MSEDTLKCRDIKPNMRKVENHFARCKNGTLKITPGISNDFLIGCTKHGRLLIVVEAGLCCECLEISRLEDLSDSSKGQVCINCVDKS